jgi:1,4-alpha-glucan branching enzyme
MNIRYALSLVLNAHLPYVREFAKNSMAVNSAEENWFSEALSETYLPLLALFDRLEGDNIPFRLGIAVSPALGQMLGDNLLLSKYTASLDHQIEFGEKEIERLKDSPGMLALAKRYFDQAVDRRASFTGRYDGNILNVLDHYREKGNIEILAAPATHAFLPFFCAFPEPVQAQIEAAQPFYRYDKQDRFLPVFGLSSRCRTLL